jgi:hypothetical protein
MNLRFGCGLVALVMMVGSPALAREKMRLAITSTKCDMSNICVGKEAKESLRFIEATVEEVTVESLKGLRGLIMMTKDNVFQVLKSAGHTDGEIQKACSQTECIVELGGALGARWLLEGQIDRLGSEYTLRIKFWDIEQSQTLMVKTARFPSLPEMAKGVVANMRDMMSNIRTELELVFDAPEDCKTGQERQMFRVSPLETLVQIAKVGERTATKSNIIRFCLSPGRYDYDARSPAYAGTKGTFTVLPNETPRDIRIELIELTTIRVTGTPAGASVKWWAPIKPGANKMEHRATFQLPGAREAPVERLGPHGRHRIQVTFPGFAGEERHFDVAANAPSDLRFELREHASIWVSGRPKGARVVVSRAEGRPADCNGKRLHPLKGDTFECRGLDGTYLLSVEKDGYDPIRGKKFKALAGSGVHHEKLVLQRCPPGVTAGACGDAIWRKKIRHRTGLIVGSFAAVGAVAFSHEAVGNYSEFTELHQSRHSQRRQALVAQAFDRNLASGVASFLLGGAAFVWAFW